MCGIFGLIQEKEIDESSQVKKAFFDLNHRGPDDKGFVVFKKNRKKIILGHTRLSIIDLSANGRQPMATPDKRYTIVFNGEIYNFKELKQDLIKKGEIFFTNTDTEVLLKMFSLYNIDCLTKLIGMFAFCVYDAHEQSVFLARDAFGIKPLFYYFVKNNFYFASEVKALKHLVKDKIELNKKICADYLDQGHYDFSEQTFFKGIQSLQAGCFLKIKIEKQIKSDEKAWWKPKSCVSFLSLEKAVKDLREQIFTSLQLHLRSDVPVAIALSGGIDSSVILGAVRAMNPTRQISGLCYNSPDSAISEKYYQNVVAKKNNCQAFFIEPSTSDLLQDLEKLISIQNEPFGGLSVYAQFKVFELAKRLGFKVVLDGQGADELFGGYFGFPGLKIVSLIKQNKTIQLIKYLALNGNTFKNKKIILGDILRYLKIDGFLKQLANPISAKTWITDSKIKNKKIEKFSKKKKNTFICNSVIKEHLINSIQQLWLPSLLRHADRNAMAFSIENRVPFLTKNIYEFCFSLPENYLISDLGKTKYIFKKAFQDYLPIEIYDRKDKNAFEVPQRKWIRQNKNVFNKYIKRWIHNDKIIKKESICNLNKVLFGPSIDDNMYWRYLNFAIWRAQNNFE